MVYGELVRIKGIEVNSKLLDTIRLQAPRAYAGGYCTRRAAAVNAAITIGRHIGSDARLLHTASTISRSHASVALTTEGAHVLTDNNSSNGTYVNDCLLPQGLGYELKHGDIVSFSSPRFMEHGDNIGALNPFGFEYRRPLDLDAWRNGMVDTWEEHRPTKRAKRGSETADSSVPWVDDDVNCAICREVFVNPYLVNGCGHTFCYGCIAKWLTERSKFCPFCRHLAMPYGSMTPIACAVTPNLAVQTMLERYVFPRLTPEVLEERIKRSREVRSLVASPVTGPVPPTAVRRIGELVLPQWKVISAEVLVDTPCSACRAIIPARFMRMRRTVIRAGVDVHHYVHVKRACIGKHLPQIHAQVGVCDSEELSEQERRVAKMLCVA